MQVPTNKIIIYYNPKCRKSREALQILKDRGYTPQIREYLKDIPSVDELFDITKKLGKTAKDMFRKSEVLYRHLGIKSKVLPDKDMLSYIVEYPILLERPIVIRGQRAVIGRPPEDIKKIL